MQLRTTLFVLTLFLFSVSQAQIVSEDVHFDYYLNASDNDFANHFSGGYGLSQIQTNGITGGCLTTPDSISWGNDNAIYCSRYKPLTGDTAFTSISFKYDSTQIHLSSYQRGMSIWLIPYSDFNHYIVATVSGDKKIEILTYGWNNNPYPVLALHHNHWYNYQLSAVFAAGQQVSVKAAVFDLGTSGTGTPLLVNSSSGTFTDNVLDTDTSIQVSITGTTYGGVAYLDDFHFEGREGISNCTNVATGIADEVIAPSINIYPTIAKNELTIEWEEFPLASSEVTIFNLTGKKMLSLPITGMKTVLDIHELPSGIYFVRCQSASQFEASKVMVVH